MINNYKVCDVCDKAIYRDNDIDYDECALVALCKSCAKQWNIVLVSNDGKEIE